MLSHFRDVERQQQQWEDGNAASEAVYHRGAQNAAN